MDWHQRQDPGDQAVGVAARLDDMRAVDEQDIVGLEFLEERATSTLGNLTRR